MQWFESWFNTPYYHILYKDRDYNEAEHFINLLVKDLELPPHARIVDLACGKGRHSLFLNQLGYNVLGLDLSEQSIQHNKQFENPSLHFAIHDMRDPMHVAEPVDAVFNLFTSFGYFENADDDLKVFQSVYDSMKSGAYFVLDFLNETYVRNTLVPEALVEKEGIKFNISKRIENNFVVKDIQFHDEGTDFHFFEKVKLSTPAQIETYAKQVGFERVKVWGNYELSDFDPETSPRCINLFIKK
ncbi:Methyltransferase domain-containing protein [Soonwooa buanensis]|uniref:Methyltransferase domain-containing protein n=1 Tax=Soonwooa buanensis TaxID=619805 RepID=A0A1T5CQU3_9FLAO|nr:class I SAM-dependent methyltransferase [Soonwooa buanensis]SKB61530.1 Methyltransferase domain-containing protein [Soonwooa buanensis]